MIPLIFLYELSIFLSVGIYKRKAQRDEEWEASLSEPEDSEEAQ